MIPPLSLSRHFAIVKLPPAIVPRRATQLNRKNERYDSQYRKDGQAVAQRENFFWAVAGILMRPKIVTSPHIREYDAVWTFCFGNDDTWLSPMKNTRDTRMPSGCG